MQAFLDWARPGSPEAELAQRLDSDRLPRHVAVIMDGNGRWARNRFLPRVAGHRAGAESVRSITEACARLGVEALTLYAFSVENWKRPAAEVGTLWDLLRRYLRQELAELKKHNIRLGAVGRIDQLPDDVQAELDYAILETAACSGMRLNLALNYGGRSEIVDAVNSLLERARNTGDFEPVDEQTISDALYTRGLPDPDLLIRTSGELRVSNFLLWQIAYTEIFVTEKYWPDFRAADLLEAFIDYQKRERRFGGLSPDAKLEPAPVSETPE